MTWKCLQDKRRCFVPHLWVVLTVVGVLAATVLIFGSCAGRGDKGHLPRWSVPVFALAITIVGFLEIYQLSQRDCFRRLAIILIGAWVVLFAAGLGGWRLSFLSACIWLNTAALYGMLIGTAAVVWKAACCCRRTRCISKTFMLWLASACVWLFAASPINASDRPLGHFCSEVACGVVEPICPTRGGAGKDSCHELLLEEVKKVNGEIDKTLAGVGSAFQYRFALVGALLAALLRVMWKKSTSGHNGTALDYSLAAFGLAAACGKQH